MRTLRDLPIGQKLLAITIVTSTVTLLLAGTGIVLSDRILFRAQLQRDLSALANIIADNSTAALAFDDSRVAREILGALKARRHVDSACIYKPDGSIFARYGRAGSEGKCQPPAEGDEVRFSPQGLVASHSILLNNRRVGTLVMVNDAGEIAERTRLYMEIVLAILLASSLLAFVLSSRLREIIGTPISRLAHAASSVSQRGDYSVRVEKYSRDELGVLVDAFNEMLGQVQSRDIEVQNARNSLQTTLSSIGDAVISTDREGHIVFANPVAQSLLRWPEQDLAGKHIDQVFRIINEFTRKDVEVPIHRVLREGTIVGLANHTILIAGDGTEVPIDDSAAPIRDARGEIRGVVLIFRDISGRRATEKLLEAQAAELRQRAHLMERVHCFVRDLQDHIIYWNQGAVDLYGFSDADAVGQISHTLLRTEFPAPLDEILGQLTREGQWDGDLVHTCRDGRRVTVASYWALHRDAENEVASILEVNVDITARKAAEQMLQESEDRFRSLANAIPQLAWIANADGWIFWYNDRWYEYTGTTAQQMEGWGWQSVHDPEALPLVLERWKASIESGEPFDMVFPLRGRDGELRPFLTRVMPVRGQDGKVARWFGTNTDITEHRRAEERFRLAVEAAPNGMVVADEAGKIVLVNSEMERLFGWSREEIIGQPVEFLVPQRVSDEHRRYREGFYADPRARLMGEGRDLRARRKDGSEFPVEIALNPMETSQGRWVLGAVVDITERKRIEEQRLELVSKERALVSERTLRETEAELARVVRALSVGELATSIAHEINQPLAGVVTNAEAGLRWLGGKTPNIEEARESLALIARDGNRASAVIRRIREFLKKGSQQTGSLDVSEVVQEAVLLARAELLKRRVALRIELSSELPLVQGDRIQLQQVVLNLIMNGAEAMGSMEGVKELLVTSQKAADGSVVVAVRDSGAGINPEDIPRMFDAFFTTKPTGMGMGLSISRTIIEAHGGRIWAEVNDGRGLTVQFGLPAESFSHAASNPS